MKKSKFTLDIETRLIKIAPKKSTFKFSDEYILGNNFKGTSKLRLLRVKIPKVRNFVGSHLTTKAQSFDPSLFSDMRNLWFESDIFEAKQVALFWLEKQTLEMLIKNKKEVLSWISEIDNWAHSDSYCSILAKLFEADQKGFLPTYIKWNKHQNPWYRRCSMVGTFYYSRSRKTHPSFKLAKQLVSPHLNAKEYYVQKAVGWTIREMYNVYPPETIKYIHNNIQEITPIAWVAASEKLPATVKKNLLQKRKSVR
jgi:3-methyladenine DNA glycosylase AlkD